MTGGKKDDNNYCSNFSSRGFTLIELLVGMAVFTILVGAMAGILISGIQLQRKSLAEQEVLDQLSFAIEYMNRSLRMGKKELSSSPSCLSARGLNYQHRTPGEVSSIRFINTLQADDCQEFYLNNGQLIYQKNADSFPLPSAFPLTSANTQIEDLKFELSGEAQGDSLQPRVTIYLRAKPQRFGSRIEIQTTLSQRNLDISY